MNFCDWLLIQIVWAVLLLSGRIFFWSFWILNIKLGSQFCARQGRLLAPDRCCHLAVFTVVETGLRLSWRSTGGGVCCGVSRLGEESSAAIRGRFKKDRSHFLRNSAEGDLANNCQGRLFPRWSYTQTVLLKIHF